MQNLPIQKAPSPQTQIIPETFNRPMWNVPTLADLLQRLSVKKPPKAAGRPPVLKTRTS